MWGQLCLFGELAIGGRDGVGSCSVGGIIHSVIAARGCSNNRLKHILGREFNHLIWSLCLSIHFVVI